METNHVIITFLLRSFNENIIKLNSSPPNSSQFWREFKFEGKTEKGGMTD